MTDFCCNCLPRACPGLHVQSKSLHEVAVLSGCLTYLSDISEGCFGDGPFSPCFVHGQRQQERLWEGAAWPWRSHASCAPAHGLWEKHWLVGEALGVQGQDAGGIGMRAFQVVA